MSESIKKSILKTVRFSNLNLYPLNYNEVFDFLLYEKNVKNVYKSIYDILISELISEQKLVLYNNFLFLKNLNTALGIDLSEDKLFDYLLLQRGKREKKLLDTLDSLIHDFKLLSKLKFIKFIGYVDTVFPKKNETLEIVLITEPNKVYLAKSSVENYLRLKNKSKPCKVIFAASVDNCKVSEINFQAASKYCFVKPIVESKDYLNVLSHFININAHLYKFFVNFPITRLGAGLKISSRPYEDYKDNLITRYIDKRLYRMLAKNMKNKENVVIEENKFLVK